MKLSVLIAFIFIFIQVICLHAKTFFVATNGNDLNSGVINHPFLTLEKGISKVTSGDSIVIREGNYILDHPIVITVSPVPTSYITICGYPGEQPVFDFSFYKVPGAVGGTNGPPFPHDMGAIILLNTAYVRIKNIKVINSGCAGIQSRKSNHIQISDCATYNTYTSGISAWNSDSIIIENNDVELACNTGPHECITISNTNNFIARNNKVHHTTQESSGRGGEGLDCKEGCNNGQVYGNYIHHLFRQAMYIDSWDNSITNLEYFDNVVHNCGLGITLGTEMGGSITNVKIHHNIIYDNDGTGLQVANWGQDGPKSNIAIYNNTIYNNGWKNIGGASGGIRLQAMKGDNIAFFNNISANNCGFQMAYNNQDPTVARFSYNLLDGYNSEPIRNAQGGFHTNNAYPTIHPLSGSSVIISDPLFVDPAKGDFRLKSNSPAINAGTPLAEFNDNDGSRNDIGAIPFSSITNFIFENLSTDDLVIYPNPLLPGESLILLMPNLTSEKSVYVLDAQGNELFNTLSSSDILELPRSRMGDTGLIFVKIVMGEKLLIKKIVIR